MMDFQPYYGGGQDLGEIRKWSEHGNATKNKAFMMMFYVEIVA